MADFHDQLSWFLEADAKRLNLLNALYQENAELQDELDQRTVDLKDQQESRRDWQRRAIVAEGTLQTKHQFALVLIDGDGYLFEDRFLQDGQAGAIAAGNMLCEHVRTQLKKQNPSLASDLDVIVRVYINKKGLAFALIEAGVLDDVAQLDTFFVKLTQCQPLFDVVDCGSGKERVDEKIRELYRHYAYDSHCRHIMVGCCHDSGYVAYLEKYQKDERVEQKTSLLVAGPPAQGFKKLPFRLMEFDDLFRTIPLKKRNKISTAYSAAVSGKTQETSPEKPNIEVSHPGGPNSGGQSLTLASGICLNVNDERVDFPMSELPGDAQKRFNAIKKRVCHDHHLGGSCRDPQECKYDHCPMSSESKQVLQYRLRRKACNQGLACRKAICFYGHHCPFPACSNQDTCQFKGMHGIDQKIASRIRPNNPV